MVIDRRHAALVWHHDSEPDDAGPNAAKSVTYNRGVRLVAILAIAACAGPPSPVAPGPPTAPVAKVVRAGAERAPVDPIAALTPIAGAEVSWLAPGKAQLELDGEVIENPGGATPIEVSIIDGHGGRVRVAIALEHVRFSLWTDRDRLFSVVRRAQRVNARGAGAFGDAHATIKAGARVKRLAHRDGWTNIRYFGDLEIEGWVPDAVLGDAGPPRLGRGRFPSGRQLMVRPGAVIRTEAKWAATELAVMANGFTLDTVKALEDGWNEVSYDDGDVTVHGFVSTQLPPGQVHRPRTSPAVTPVPVTPTAKVPNGTCLYARAKGDPIGYILGDRDVALAEGELGWFELTIDSPWGPIAFAARGPSRADLQACAPTAP